MTVEGRGTFNEAQGRQSRQVNRGFAAYIGRFRDRGAQQRIDQLAAWVEDTYQRELQARPSMHVYVRNLPDDIIANIDRLRDSEAVQSAILKQFAPDTVITPMKHTDELYVSHYNKDYGGDHGLFTKHYDGNLRFIPVGAVVRALIYLQSDATYKVVFGDSQVDKAFETYDFGLLDFHRELHWVEGEYNPGNKQRILLKCNYLVAPRGSGWIAKTLLAANTGVFYFVKSAMEYSKSPSTVPQYAVGYACNLMRLANNIHPLVPILSAVVVVLALGWGLASLLPG